MNFELRRYAAMSEPEKHTDLGCDRLHRRMALTIALDEQLIASLAVAAVVLRDAGDPSATDLEGVIRTNRVGIIKQRAILGAAGIKV